MTTPIEHLQDMRRFIMNQLPPEGRFTPQDAATIGQHQALLLGLTDEIVQGFYNSLYAHGPTAEIFRDGERPALEKTLTDWWKRVVTSEPSEQFWDWMTFVGLVHVVRKVKNPMMIGAWSFIEDFVSGRIGEALPREEAVALIRALSRFGMTFNALVAESYILHYMQAVTESTGTTPVLLDRLVITEIDTILNGVKPSFR